MKLNTFRVCCVQKQLSILPHARRRGWSRPPVGSSEPLRQQLGHWYALVDEDPAVTFRRRKLQCPLDTLQRFGAIVSCLGRERAEDVDFDHAVYACAPLGGIQQPIEQAQDVTESGTC